MHPDDPDIDSMPDVGQWADGTCPTCGGAVRCRQTNLRAVARTGDETLADREYRHIALFSERRYVALRKQRDDLLAACRVALNRYQITIDAIDAAGYPEGNQNRTRLVADVETIRAAIANAEPQPKE